ncbi:BMP family ABC transporter substrate-binding protein [Tabrizicola aquatica]|uniref:BMP family ABC transporter substrate-binding protein n=1 Tax=Tabrizicola aquatica TaxID=909926 RepID=UPI000CD3273A|nr:BMP family ABC transporter substrate-binding protein [Tabrizicola aquatica]
MLKTTCFRAAVFAFGMALPAAGQTLEKVKACFVYLGPLEDSGWTYQHHIGAESAKAGLGDRMELVWQDNVPEDSSAEAVIEDFARSGCDIIFTTSFGFMDQTNAIAAKYPNVKFEHATGYKRDTPNVSTYNARFYEGRAVEGLLAGYMTRTNKIGYVASYPIPEVLAGINAYYLAAKRVNPDVELEVRWAYTWFDPKVEGEAAQSMIDAGVDVIAAHTDSTATLEAAAATGGSVLGFGQASDMIEFRPSPRISAIVNNWGPYYFERISALLDGTYTQSDTFKGMSQAVLIGLITEEVPASVRLEAEKLRDALAAGQTNAFVGPIRRQDGSLWLAEGEFAPDADILGMNFLVEGIAGDIPQ